jgi:hypothetical protein
MNGEERREGVGLAYLVGIIGCLVIIGLLSLAIYRYTQPPPLNANRADERAKALAEIHGIEKDALENTGWIDQSKGQVRLRIEDAMKLVEREWKNPAMARSNFIARVEKANPAPAPPPPNPFE